MNGNVSVGGVLTSDLSQVKFIFNQTVTIVDNFNCLITRTYKYINCSKLHCMVFVVDAH